MKPERPTTLTSYSETQRQRALERYQVLAPHLKQGQSLVSLARTSKFSLRTLKRWKQAYLTLGLVGLINKPRCDRGQVKVTVEIQHLSESLILHYPKLSCATVHRKVQKLCREQGLTPPSYYQVSQLKQQLDPALLELAQHGATAYRDKHELVKIRQAQGPNEIWQADHTLLDLEVLNEKGQPQRPWFTVILDDYSRAVAGYLVTFNAPNIQDTALALHQAIWPKKEPTWLICGIPQTFYTDHGSDFTSKRLEQVALDLKFNLLFSWVGIPRGRGKIERFFKTVNQLFLSELPGYLGHKNTKPLLTMVEFEKQLRHFLIDNYNHREHSTLKTTPNKRWNQEHFLPRLPVSLAALDLLLLEVPQTRKVHADGIHFLTLHYSDPDLTAYIGETVLLRYTPHDLAEVRVFYRQQFLCTAIAQEISAYTVDIKELDTARQQRKKLLQQQLQAPSTVEL